MSLRFNPSSAMTLGVEIELQILEANTLNLTPAAPRILSKIGDTLPYVKPELFQSVLEINTGICRNVHQVHTDLTRTLDVVRGHCRGLGLDLGSAGTHPFARYIGRLVYPEKRYRDLIDRNRWLAQRLLIFVYTCMSECVMVITPLRWLTPCCTTFPTCSRSRRVRLIGKARTPVSLPRASPSLKHCPPPATRASSRHGMNSRSSSRR